MHVYTLCTCLPYHELSGKRLDFSSRDPDNFPPPSPELLAMHAACAKVAHLSGARQLIDEELGDDRTGPRALQENGASAHILDHALWVTIGREMAANG